MAGRRIPRPTSYPALLLTQNDRRFYFATIPIEDLFPYCFVSRRDEDPVDGFQRTLNKGRAEDIARYLSQGQGSIPTNIVLSAQADAVLKYERKTKSISFERIEKAFLILDGQHRLWGYQLCKDTFGVSLRVPIAAYEGLNRQEEAQLFIDINTLQRGVPAALLLDIKQVAQIETDFETNLREIFDRLAADPKSALNGRLSAASASAGKITRVTFNRAVGKALKSNAVPSDGKESTYRVIRNYINAFDAELEDKAYLSKPAFFEAIFDVFDDVVRRSITEKGNVKQSSIQTIVRPAAKIDFAGQAKVTKLTPTALVIVIRGALQRAMKITGDMV